MKKGFSLIELLVSLVIISVILVFITSFIVSIKDEKNGLSLNVPVLIDQAAISKILNNDANKNGISSITKNNNNKITITYKDETTGVIEISSSTLKYSKNNNVELIKTLKNATFSSISFVSSDENYYKNFSNGKKYFKYVINISTGDKIEVYYYGD